LLNYPPNHDLEIVSVFQLMADAGVRAPDTGLGRITVHDSCLDREGETGGWVRRILSHYEIVEMAHHGARTLCCGSGGMVSMVDRELYHRRTRKRAGEFQDTGAEVCVTYCMACCYTLWGAARPGRVRHVLELPFNRLIDHAQFAARLEAMWQGEWGEYNIYRLGHSRLMEPVDNE
jgi:Fe-S oxidoreductase